MITYSLDMNTAINDLANVIYGQAEPDENFISNSNVIGSGVKETGNATEGTHLNPNPFNGKSAEEIDKMLTSKGFETRGPDPLNGKGGYVNPQNGRSYHIDFNNSFNENPHVDVNRLRGYN